MIGKFVVVRTINAGVHFGTLVEVINENYQTIRLENARRLWQWSGALSLSEVAMKGVKIAESKIAERLDEIILTQVIEIIPVSLKSNLPGNHERKSISAKI